MKDKAPAEKAARDRAVRRHLDISFMAYLGRVEKTAGQDSENGVDSRPRVEGPARSQFYH